MLTRFRQLVQASHTPSLSSSHIEASRRNITRLTAALLAPSLAIGLALASSAGAAVYWTNHTSPYGVYDEDSIGRANLDGGVVNQSFIFGARGPCGVAVDGSYIYWANANPAGDTIGSANLDGSEVDQSFIRGGAGPCGVAVDENFIYWANMFGGDTISRANILGEGLPNEAFILGASGPSAVAVDKKFVYWTNSGQNTSNSTDANTIGRAKLDGTEAPKQNFITGASTPRGIAVDGAHIYWANTGTGTIGRANLEGLEVNQEFIKGAGQPCGVAVDGSHVYWADRYHGTIGRANLDGTGADDSFITGATEPCGVAVDSVVVPPVPVIASPANGAIYTQGQTVAANYTCAPPVGASLTACTGPVANGAAIDTSTLGQHIFVVTATDSDRVSELEAVIYTVKPKSAAPAPAPAPDNTFVGGILRVEPNGTIVLSEQARDPGIFTAVARTSHGYLARLTHAHMGISSSAQPGRCKRTKTKSCERNYLKLRPALYGTGSTSSPGTVAVQLTIKPNSRSKAALASGRSLHVEILVTFQSNRGGTATSALTKTTVKGTTKHRRKHK